MAESVDALVSNTSGATRAGSTPALGTGRKSSLAITIAGDFCFMKAFYTAFIDICQFITIFSKKVDKLFFVFKKITVTLHPKLK